ncbi:MAG: FAD-dependent oxidoreductase [Chloroflexota bacterium]|nr:FAD-dependent oxidoreductase [Chloroflexota bacterium]
MSSAPNPTTEDARPDEDLNRRAFPVLSERQVGLLRPFGTVRTTSAGDVLFELGDEGYDLVVVLEGRTEIVERSDGTDRVLKTSGPGEFHGELGLLTGQTVFAACVVRDPGRVLLVPPAKLREAIETVPELSDVLVTAFAARRQVLMRSAAATLSIVGPETSPAVLALEEFAARNRVPHRVLTPDDPAARRLLAAHPATDAAVRVVIRGQKVLDDPSHLTLARALGLDLVVRQDAPADLLVVGAGPAGLAAAVYGASEGLKTVIVDDVAIGGQAGTSSRIENYLGFPTGISGGDLAFKAEVQAIKFGARVTVPRRATALDRDGDAYVVRLDDGTALRGRSVIVATGARYRRLGLPNQEEFDGAGVYYAATELEARYCRGEEVVVVGAGNSAGQAAMFLAGSARCVHLLVRGPDLARSMSRYLIARLERSPAVRVRTETRVRELRGDASGHLAGIVVDAPKGSAEIPTPALFVMIGADPCTDWLRGTLDLDDKGFVLSGRAPAADAPSAASPYQTSLPGVFAVGDVRAGSVKRVASAVGEGSVVVQAVHAYLAAMATADA